MHTLATAWRRATFKRLGARVLAMLAFAPPAVADDIYIADYRLHIACEGRGAPTVVLDAGLGGSSLEWVFVTQRLRETTRVCAYDRAGYGVSDMGSLPRTSSHIANELYLLLEGSGEPAPYILVGHSFGGYNMQLFARRYPYLSAGLVLIDASHPQQVERFLAPPLKMLTAPTSRYGIVQFRDPPPPHARLPEPLKREVLERARRWKTRRTLANELLSFRDSAHEVDAAPALGDVPVFVITRGMLEGEPNPRRMQMERLWVELQSELAGLSSTSAHLVARASGHNIHIEQPDLVAFAIATLVERHRGSMEAGSATGLFGPGRRTRFPLDDATWLKDDLSLYPETVMADGHAYLCAAGIPCRRADAGAP